MEFFDLIKSDYPAAGRPRPLPTATAMLASCALSKKKGLALLPERTDAPPPGHAAVSEATQSAGPQGCPTR